MTFSTYATRRARLLDAMPERAVALFPSQPVAVRNSDVEHGYRQHSDLFYLTGLDEPECVLVLSKVHPDHRTVLFLRPRDEEKEQWDGSRLGVDGAKNRLGADEAFPIEELPAHLADYLEDADSLFVTLGENPEFESLVTDALALARRRHRRGKAYPTALIDPTVLLHEQRLRKTEDEVALMRRAADVTRDAHLAAMAVAVPGAHEYEVEAELRRVFRRGGSERVAYDPIVGSGPNATVLHYRQNRRRLEDGDLLLIDAGAELGYYAADVTRTFPVSGTYSEPQRALYDVVLAAQEAAVDAVKPGATVVTVHEAGLRVIVEGLVRLGLVEGPVDEAIEEERYKPFFMHRTSHWLGMDVHDVGRYFLDGEARPLEPGFVLTVEPGIYVSTDSDVDPKWRGIGIRIEDDIVVTETGFENLTDDIPKDPNEVEAILAARTEPSAEAAQ